MQVDDRRAAADAVELLEQVKVFGEREHLVNDRPLAVDVETVLVLAVPGRVDAVGIGHVFDHAVVTGFRVGVKIDQVLRGVEDTLIVFVVSSGDGVDDGRAGVRIDVDGDVLAGCDVGNSADRRDHNAAVFEPVDGDVVSGNQFAEHVSGDVTDTVFVFLDHDSGSRYKELETERIVDVTIRHRRRRSIFFCNSL